MKDFEISNLKNVKESVISAPYNLNFGEIKWNLLQRLAALHGGHGVSKKNDTIC